MAGRNRMLRHPDDFRGYHDGPQPVLNRGLRPRPIHPAALEEELDIQHREMLHIISENRLVIDENTHLQRELTAAKDEIHRLGQIIPKLRAEKETQTRELIDRGMKLEAELRAAEPLRSEVMQLRAEVQKLNALRQELTAKVQGLTKDINHLQAENKELTTMKADINVIRKQLVETRRAYEHGKKANEEQVEQKQLMEKDLISVAREVEKLRAEQVNAERRARGFGDGVYGMSSSSQEMRYSGGGSGGYSSSWGSYDSRSTNRR